jgi:tetratricopeptide (TPR) repeat protein/CHAT domain-containing protein
LVDLLLSEKIPSVAIATPPRVTEADAQEGLINVLSFSGKSLASKFYPEKGMNQINNAKAQSPEFALNFDAGLMLVQAGLYKGALACFDKALKLKPKLAKVWDLRGFTLVGLGHLEKALASFDEALRLNPELHNAWDNRGVVLQRLGRYEESVASHLQALKLDPKMSRGWHNTAKPLESLGRYEEALENYNQALTLNPEVVESWIGRALMLSELERYEEALASFDKVVKLNPKSADSWSSRGNILCRLERYEEALISLDKSLKLNPDLSTSWCCRGHSLEKLGRYEEALASYCQATKLNPDFEVHKTLTLLQLGRYEEALISQDQGLSFKLFADAALSWNIRGICLNKLGQYEEAIVNFDQAVKLNPNLAEIWANRGATLENLGRYVEAVASCDQALSLDPRLAFAWINRGSSVSFLSSYVPTDVFIFLQNTSKSLDHSTQVLSATFHGLDKDKEFDTTHTLASIHRSISKESIQNIEQNIFLQPGRLHAELQVGGYQGALNSYRAELGEHSQDEPKKAICKDTCPKGWGELHRAIGRAHYIAGRRQTSPQSYWRKAENSFKRALETLQPPQFETLYFETLQDLIRVLIDLGETQEVETLQQEATAHIQRVLMEPDHRHGRQQQLGLWLAKFEQLTVDAAIQAKDFRKALSTAELAKNVCLRWLLDLGEVPEVTVEQMQALVDGHTAMVYWHLSPAALTTFLLLPGAREPVVIPPPDLPVEPEQTLANDERPLGLKQILRWEDWLSQWNQDYETYSSAQKKTDQTVELTAWRRGHPWRTQMVSRLDSLGQLLNVEAIHAALRDHPIQRLRLIPHRDLHRLPLHFFFDQYDCTYLPSAKVGLDRLPQTEPPVYRDLLIAENPKSTATVKTLTQKLDELPFAEVEAELIRQRFREAGDDQPGQITTLENQQVPYNRLLSALGQGQDVFHFTGRGLYNRRNPAQSCLFLTGGDRLTLADIVHPDPDLGYDDLSRYHLVFLAACETGVAGNQTITDDYVGLVSAVLKARAGGVVSTLWRIESGSSLIFVSRFYQALLDGDTPARALPPAKALRTAQDFLKNATYDQIRETFQDYIVLIDRSSLELNQDLGQDEKERLLKEFLDKKESLKLTLQDELDRMGSNPQAASTMESHQPPDYPYRHPYYWAAYTVSGL